MSVRDGTGCRAAVVVVTALLAAASGSGVAVAHAGSTVRTAATATPAQPLADGSPDYSFEPSGLDGAGFQNVLAMSRTADSEGNWSLLSGGDVSGYQRSNDGGLHWRASDAGAVTLESRHVASVALSEDPATPGKAYGAAGLGGGLYVSSDWGQTWSRRSAEPHFNGVNALAATGLPAPHPRSTGNLIAQDPASTTLWVATFDQGVLRSGDDGATWTATALAPDAGGIHYLRSLVKDPANPDVLYAASYGRGVWRAQDARSGMTFTQVPGSPANPEEMTVVAGTLYVAAGSAGVLSYDSATGAWTDRNAGVLANGGTSAAVWQSIAGYADAGGSVVLYVGCGNCRPSAAGSTYDTVVKSVNGGGSWTSTTAGTSVSSTLAGANEQYWLAASNPGPLLNGGKSVASHILVSAQDPATVYVAGRSGVWRSSNGGQTWAPAVRGLGVTINRAIVPDPRVPGRVYVANTDWRFLYSTDRMKHVRQNVPTDAGGIAGSAATAVALDTTTNPSTVYVSAGNRDINTEGEVWSNPDPANPQSSWKREGLGAAVGGNRPRSTAVGTSSGARVILTAVEEGGSASIRGGTAGAGGVWRKVGNGSWAKVSPAGLSDAPSNLPSIFSWVPGSPIVYLYDRSSGVWRSDNAGASGSWTKLWSQPVLATSDGFVAADPVDPRRLYVSLYNAGVQGIYRFDDTTAGAEPVEIGSFTEPQAITVDGGGRLWVSEVPTSESGTPQLSYSSNPAAADPAFTATADGVYRGTAVAVNMIAVDDASYVYAAMQGTGAIVGVPSGSFPVNAPGAPTAVTATAGDASATVSWTAPADNGGSRITGYVLTPYADGIAQPPRAFASAATTQSITGLTNGTAFTFTVAAQNSVGTGPDSAASNAVTPAAAAGCAGPCATVTAPKMLTKPIVVTFSEAVSNVTPANVVVRVKDGPTNLPAKLSCKSAAGTATSCSNGSVSSARLLPTYVPGQLYTVIVDPAGMPPVTSTSSGSAVPLSSSDFRAATTLEQDAPTTYSWGTVTETGANGGTYTTEHTAGASASFAFRGSSVSWYAVRGPDQGVAAVYVDGALKLSSVNDYATSREFNIVHSVSGLSSGAHTFKILVKGTKGNAAATDTRVSVDAFRVGSGSVVPAPSVTYTWARVTNAAASGGSYAVSDMGLGGTGDTGPAVSLTFRGTGITLGTVVGPDQGMAAIYVDGVLQSTIDQYAAAVAYNQSRTVSGLADALHTVRVVVLSTKNASATGRKLAVDRWLVT